VGAIFSACNWEAWFESSAQLSLKATRCPLLSNSSRVGLLSALLIPNWVSDGPMARTTTFTGLVLLPPREKPPIITLSAVWTEPRVLMFASLAVAPELRS
jgi:hypothetical protein